MEIVVFILYSNKKLLIYHFHQETNSIVHRVEIEGWLLELRN